MQAAHPIQPKDRFEVYRFFNGLAAEGKEGLDRHLWQPINIEMNEKSLVAILPQATCGNTFHRLVTNIQAYVRPSIDAWLGGEPFQGIVDNSIAKSGGYADER